MNHSIIVGRLVNMPELNELDSGKKVCNVTVAVQRSYKNVDGEYETDFIDCVLWNPTAEHTAEYCQKGDIIGVKGRLQTRIVEKEDGTKVKKTELIGERISFLSSSKENDEEKEME